MRILFLSQLLPLPLDAGPKIRAYYVLRSLAERGHEVTLICFTRAGDREEDVEALRRICSSVHTVRLPRSRIRNVRDVLASLAERLPFLVLRDRQPAMRRKIRELCAAGSFDAFHADQLWMAPYALEHGASRLKVLDQHNAVFRIPLQLAGSRQNPLIRLFLRKEASKLAAFERSACRQFDKVVWVAAADKEAVLGRENADSSRHRIIPIATDPVTRRPVERPHPFRVTFLGGMHWPPNAEGASWFVRRVWPEVARAAPQAVLTLIGKGSPRRFSRADTGARIHIAGYVTDLRPYLSETAAFIVPLKSGAGMRVKILDAWCWALPVISTSVGADGIEAVHEENLLIANDEKSFSECLIRVLRDSQLSRRLADKGRSTVESFYNWRNVYRSWDAIYR